MDDQYANYVANNILGSFPAKDDSGPRRGRRTLIEDGRLWATRDSVAFLLEATWHDVGDKLPRLRKANDVYEALRVWENDNRYNLLYVTRALLRPTGYVT